MFKLENFFSALDTNGGHILILSILIAVGIAGMFNGMSEGKWLVEFFGGAALLAMKGRNGQKG